MKKINLYVALGIAGLVTATSCKKLDVVPKYEIATTQSFQTVKDGQAWDAGFYVSLRGRWFGSYFLQSDTQADYLNASLDYGNNYGFPQRWDDGFISSDQTLTAMWNAYYSAIANLNTAIAGFPTIVTTGATDAASMNKYTADAYLLRAYYYHQLVIRWAKPYETATAASDLGVPLVLKYNLTEKPARASVQAVYTQILADITQAETLYTAAGNVGAQNSTVLTADAAKALEARVRLFMHDYANAYTAANAVIATGKYPLITTAAGMSTYWKNDGGQESITQLFVNNTTDVPSNNSIYITPKSATNYDALYLPSQWVIDLYPATDIRKGVYFNNTLPMVILGTSYPGLSFVGKFQGNPALFTGALTNTLQAPKIFRVAEMYLIAAEAAESLTTPNEPNALTALNALKVARGETASATTGAALVQDIRDERLRELAFEGSRLDDLKRWHLGFTRHAPQNANALVQGAGYAALTIAPDAVKFTWGIPFADVSINPNLVQNPGW